MKKIKFPYSLCNVNIRKKLELVREGGSNVADMYRGKHITATVLIPGNIAGR